MEACLEQSEAEVSLAHATDQGIYQSRKVEKEELKGKEHQFNNSAARHRSSLVAG